ncbi:hypothetical protein AGR1B_Cc120485 [Agrobacterium fabacearum S56]|nr:hypothetical protein AGR1B_Cc120485 [Agrobacterium fabacearum S56]
MAPFPAHRGTCADFGVHDRLLLARFGEARILQFRARALHPRMDLGYWRLDRDCFCLPYDTYNEPPNR